MRPPAFWDTEAPRGSAALTRALLTPLSMIYAWAGARRIARSRNWRAPVPVICVGNLTLGGTGKTPVVAGLVRLLTAQGRRAASLSRGWKGELAGPVRVQPGHTARQVGDEPRLLANGGEAWISRDRPAGAAAMADAGVEIIVMDDGHQNPTLHKDFSLIVVDGQSGWGACRVFPAGPLREPVESGLARAHAVIVMMPDGETPPDLRSLKLDTLSIPVLTAWLEPVSAPPTGPLLAFAGIGRPQKFYDALTAAGATLADTASFPDHHSFSSGELEQLADLAEAHQASLITTEKDWVRLPASWQAGVTAWPVQVRFSSPQRITDLLAEVVDGAPAPH